MTYLIGQYQLIFYSLYVYTSKTLLEQKEYTYIPRGLQVFNDSCICKYLYFENRTGLARSTRDQSDLTYKTLSYETRLETCRTGRFGSRFTQFTLMFLSLKICFLLLIHGNKACYTLLQACGVFLFESLFYMSE